MKLIIQKYIYLNDLYCMYKKQYKLYKEYFDKFVIADNIKYEIIKIISLILYDDVIKIKKIINHYYTFEIYLLCKNGDVIHISPEYCASTNKSPSPAVSGYHTFISIFKYEYDNPKHKYKIENNHITQYNNLLYIYGNNNTRICK